MAYTETITSMTSVFTPPASCSASWTYEDSFYNSVDGGLLMQNLLPGQGADECFPVDFGAYGRAPSSVQVYSPGACPEGYATPGAFNNAGTTTAICCPSDFSYYSTYSSINYFGTTSVLYQGCISTLQGTTTVSARSGNTGLRETVVSGPLTMWGQPVIVQYEQQDLSLFTTTTTTVTRTASSSTSTATPTISSSQGSNSNGASNSSAGLSAGAKAGIAVGVVIGVFAIAALVGFFIWRHRRNKTATQAADTPAPYGYTPGQPSQPQTSMVSKPLINGNGNGIYEFYSGDRRDGRQEIAGNPVPKLSLGEMEGSSTASGSAHGTVTGTGTGYGSATTNGAVSGGTNPMWTPQASRNSRPIELE